MESLVSESMAADADSFWILIGHDMPIEVRAAIAAGAGDNQRALDLLESVTTGEILGPYPLPFRTFTRLLKGNLLLEEGQYAKAEGWFATFPWINEQSWDTIVLLTPAFRGRAKALDALGRSEDALHYYRRFVTRWQDADPHLQPQVEEARQRIRELEAELN